MTARTFGAACAFSFAASLCMAPGVAHAGFLEQLFGAAPQPAPLPQAVAPAYGYDEAPRYYQEAPVPRRPRHRIVDEKPKLQKPTELMRDATLQPGDAVMMKNGIHIYTGYDGADRHTKADFEPLDAVRGVDKRERRALVAMDTTRNDPLRGTLNPDVVASGRSAAVATSIVKGRDIVDARGHTVRYVGP